VDTARILSSLHTAHFQYIPAAGAAHRRQPESAAEYAALVHQPQVRGGDGAAARRVFAAGAVASGEPSDSFCAMKQGLVLPAEGAPAGVCHRDGARPVSAYRIRRREACHARCACDCRPGQGRAGAHTGNLCAAGRRSDRRVRGEWGFDNWEGPRYQLVAALPGKWTLAASDQSALVVGRDDTLHIDGPSTVCVEKVEAQTAGKATLALQWKTPKPGALEVTVPLKDASPGPVSVALYQFGLAQPDRSGDGGLRRGGFAGRADR